MSKILKKIKDVANPIGDFTKKVLGVVDPIGKRIANGLKKVFHKVWENPIGKVVIIAVAVYFTGGLAGWWKTPFTGAAGGAVAGAAPVAGASAPAVTGGALSGGAGNATLLGGTASGAGAATSGEILAGAGLNANFGLATTAELGGYGAATGAGAAVGGGVGSGAAAGGGILGKVMSTVKAVGSFAAENQVLTAMALSGVSSAMQPDPYEAYEKAEKERRKLWERNTAVQDIDIGIRPNPDRRPGATAAPVEPSPLAMSEPAQPAPSSPQS